MDYPTVEDGGRTVEQLISWKNQIRKLLIYFSYKTYPYTGDANKGSHLNAQ